MSIRVYIVVIAVILYLKPCFIYHTAVDTNHGDLQATGRQAGTAAAAAAGLALATIAMITEFLIYSGFAPRVKMINISLAVSDTKNQLVLSVILYDMYISLFTESALAKRRQLVKKT